MKQKQKFQVDYGFEKSPEGQLLDRKLVTEYATSLAALKRKFAKQGIDYTITIWSYTDNKTHYYKPRVK